jgi:hypothetical protein
MVNINFLKRQKSVAVIDVSPGGASVAILACPADSSATVLAQGRSALTLEERTDSQAKSLVASQVKEAAEQALKLYRAAGHKAPLMEAYIVMHAPWCRSTVVHAEERYETDTRISPDRIAALGKTALAKVPDMDTARLLEGSVIQVALNGYRTSSPEGKSARSLRITALASECDDTVRQAVESAVHTAFPAASLLWRSGLRALLALSREGLPLESFLVIDMGVDDTHIISVHESDIDQLIVPEGARTILSRISGKRVPEETLGLMRMRSRDACSGDACQAIESDIAAAEPDLVKVFGEARFRMTCCLSRIPTSKHGSHHSSLE